MITGWKPLLATEPLRAFSGGIFRCMIVLAGFVCATLHAQSPRPNVRPDTPRFLSDEISQEVRLPTSANNPLGWTIRVRASSLATADIMRVEVEFATTGGPTTAEQQFDLRLIPLASGHSPPQSSVAVSLPLSISQGTDRVRLSRHVPKTSFGNLYQVELRADGRAIPDCKAVLGQPIADAEYSVYVNEAQQNAWHVLWIESDADESTHQESLQLWSLFDNPMPLAVASTPEQWAELGGGALGVGQLKRFQNVKMQNMPLDWRALRPYDAIMIHRTDWEAVESADSSVAIALRDWVHAGGVVIVRDASPPPAGAGASSSDAVPAQDALDTVSHEGVAARFDTFATMDEQTFVSQNPYADLTPERIKAWQAWFPTSAEMLRQSLREYPSSRATGRTGVRRRDDLAGMVIYLGPRQDEEPVQILQWAAVHNLMSWHRPRLTRNGAEPILGSQRFFQWVIPGVSQPPVYTFMGLLGMFVILVGPVAYRKTAKAGRSYLMFAIAPVLALTTTGAMLGYGVIADGFGTRVRSRQITWVDGATGDAFTRTRSTYFAGIRPADGLTFAADAEVTLYPDNQNQSWESRVDEHFETRGLVSATSEDVGFSREFLPSRQQRQFVVHRPTNGWGRIRVKAATEASAPQSPGASPKQFEDGTPFSGPDSIIVSSETDAALQELLICDEKRRYFFVAAVAAGETVTAKRISRETASKRMGDLYKRQWLISSNVGTGQTASQRNLNRGNNTTDLLTQQLSTIDSSTKPIDGVFENELQQRLQLRSDLPANSFIGLCDLTGDAIAISTAEPTDSIHYVFGSLP